MTIIDTHTHVFLDDFDNDRPEMMRKALENRVIQMVLPNIDTSTLNALYGTKNTFSTQCQIAIGLHPCSVKENYLEELGVLKEEIEKHNPVAIGETGIDLYWDKTFLAQQIHSFATQIQWAAALKKPV